MPLNSQQREAFLEVAELIESRKQFFDMSSFVPSKIGNTKIPLLEYFDPEKSVHECGTAGCIACYAAMLDYDEAETGTADFGRKKMHLSRRNADRLFLGGSDSVWYRYVDHPMFERCRYQTPSSITADAAILMLRGLAKGELTLTADNHIDYVLHVVQKERLKAVQTYIDLYPYKFDMGSWSGANDKPKPFEECGTIGCIAGYAATLMVDMYPERLNQFDCVSKLGRDFLELEYPIAEQLFVLSGVKSLWYRCQTELGVNPDVYCDQVDGELEGCTEGYGSITAKMASNALQCLINDLIYFEN